MACPEVLLQFQVCSLVLYAADAAAAMMCYRPLLMEPSTKAVSRTPGLAETILLRMLLLLLLQGKLYILVAHATIAVDQCQACGSSAVAYQWLCKDQRILLHQAACVQPVCQ